ncbi:MAG TPA: hypothetical protein VFV89_07415 [Nocardioides sp.]|uniref:hypothetical protein n=1 Tax=Nocardioides sp. TaxID=35761 RepID=UPI002E317EF7|nr:hypothetical protein [Nocardioides sp.]HEX5087619.1 hypothetical protein [Nocardioides sp.]
MTGPRRWRHVAAAAGLVAIASAAAGCAPGTPDGDSWRIDAQRAVSDASSSVQTAELALRENRRGRVFDRYLQTVLVDAERGVGKAGDAIGTRQPPRAEQKRYQAVTSQIDEAGSLVSTARIAVVDRESDRYEALADRLEAAAQALKKLEDDLEHPPAAAG